jgi:mannose-6-phosphate isomerase
MEKFVQWNRLQALPVWATRGFDAEHGRFFERLDLNGDAIVLPHRAMVQARQIYVFAHASALGWFPEGATLAETAMKSLRRDFIEDGAERASIAFSIDPLTGAKASDVRDSYTTAFVLFATAHLYALNGDRTLLALADRIIAHVDRDIMDPLHRGVSDVAGDHTAPKRQNPQMHLLEAYLALEQAAPGRGYLKHADALITLFYDKLVDEQNGVLLEYFSGDWNTHPDPAMAAVFEPGHHYEWIWLLDRHEQAAGADHALWSSKLQRAASQFGHASNGLIVDEVNANGSVTKPSHRLWPHTEAIKAAAVRHRAGDPEAYEFANKMATLLADQFLDRPFVGGWTDQITEAGAAKVGYVPASSLYHLFLAASEAADLRA